MYESLCDLILTSVWLCDQMDQQGIVSVVHKLFGSLFFFIVNLLLLQIIIIIIIAIVTYEHSTCEHFTLGMTYFHAVKSTLF